METLFNRSGSPATPNVTNEKGVKFHVYKRKCGRCGGMGRAEKWAYTGYVCYQCSGSCYSGENRDRLYTQAELDKLNARKAVRDEKKQAETEERRCIEEERVAAELVQVRKQYASLVKRIRDAAGNKADQGFFASIIDQVENKAKQLSDRQVEAVEGILVKMEAENARLQNATYVGVIGERREFELTLTKYKVFGDKWTGITYYVTMRTPEGNTVFYKGASPQSLGLRMEYDHSEGYSHLVEGSTTKCIAMVKEHRLNSYSNEPETVIQRPKAI